MQINYFFEKYTSYGELIIIDQFCKRNGIHKLIDQHLGSRGAFSEYSYSDIFMGLVYSQLSNGRKRILKLYINFNYHLLLG